MYFFPVSFFRYCWTEKKQTTSQIWSHKIKQAMCEWEGERAKPGTLNGDKYQEKSLWCLDVFTEKRGEKSGKKQTKKLC